MLVLPLPLHFAARVHSARFGPLGYVNTIMRSSGLSPDFLCRGLDSLGLSRQSLMGILRVIAELLVDGSTD